MNVFPPGDDPIDPSLKPIEKIKPDKEFEKVKPDKEAKLEKREKEKFEKEGKTEKEKREKEKDFKEIKQEKLEFKEGKLESKELKLEKVEVPETKIEKIEVPEKQIGEIGGKEIAETPGFGQAVNPALDPDTLMQHAANLEQTGRQLRHFIEQSLRPDLSTGALRGEEDLQRDEEAEGDAS